MQTKLPHNPIDDISESRVTSPSHNSARGSSRRWITPATYLGFMLLGAGLAIGGGYVTALQPQRLTDLGATLVPEANQEVAQPVPGDNVPGTAALRGTLPNNFITAAVEQVGPAVVRIDATKTVTGNRPAMFNDPTLRNFFGLQGELPPPSKVRQGVGSGFILNQKGEILTNAHVVSGADTVNVTLQDGRTFEGQVLGQDPVTDVAVIKINAPDLPTVTLGDADTLKPGEWAIAIGNPLGLDSSVTAGIVSATGRSSGQAGVPTERVNFIQTDVAINPGNSGGPLLNASGEVIGMNTAIIQNAQGIGFAIPINTAQRIAQQLIATGTVEHAYLGIQLIALNPQVQQQINADPNSGFQVKEDQGILIAGVAPNSPAAQAGLRAGDIIRKIDGSAVKDAEAVQQKVEATGVGGQLQLELLRQGQPQTLRVKAGKLPAATSQRG